MKVIIAGSRTVTDYFEIVTALTLAGYTVSNLTEIISGTARGVDQLGELLAYKNNISIKKFPADWDKYGKSAGYRRNADMAKYADALIAIWDGQSKGTKHMIKLMNKEDKPVFIHEVKKWE